VLLMIFCFGRGSVLLIVFSFRKGDPCCSWFFILGEGSVLLMVFYFERGFVLFIVFCFGKGICVAHCFLI
jgi:hypothetical protein